jgi:DNA-binding response OmpR family regulator
VTKPFGVREILARVHAASAGSTSRPRPRRRADTFRIGETVVDRKRFLAVRGKTSHELTARELKLLELFHERKGEVLSRDLLLNEVWGIEYLGTTRTLDQHIAQVRKKVGDDVAAKLIKTVHGVGYQYVG